MVEEKSPQVSFHNEKLRIVKVGPQGGAGFGSHLKIGNVCFCEWTTLLGVILSADMSQSENLTKI